MTILAVSGAIALTGILILAVRSYLGRSAD